MSHLLTAAQMNARYHEQEEYAKIFLQHAQQIAANDPQRRRVDEVRRLLAETLRAAAEARRLRRDIERHYPGTDVGHDRAIDWVHDNLIVPARALLDSLHIIEDPEWTMKRCRPFSNYSHYHRERRSADGLFDDHCEPARACVIDPGNTKHVYFFADIATVIIDPRPGSTHDTIVEKPTAIIKRWSCLIAADMFTIDAALPNPANHHEVYFFSGSLYALVDIFKDKIVNGPKTIIDEWPSLRAAGFSMIDAVLPNPDNSHEAYFFSDRLYALVSFKPGKVDDHIVNGPKVIVNEWASLRAAGFDYVDSAIPNPANHKEAYFFRGSDYVLVSIRPGTNDDHVINGPKPVHTEWPSLRKASFY